MNGFHSDGRLISAHDSASTIGKKIANWIVGNSISGPSVTACMVLVELHENAVPAVDLASACRNALRPLDRGGQPSAGLSPAPVTAPRPTYDPAGAGWLAA